MEKDKDITRVIFKKDYNKWIKEWEVFACLLDCEVNPGKVVIYQHVGQHSEGDILYCANCKWATIDEYYSLMQELESIGYNLKVVRKFNYKKGKGAYHA
jgi:hypothetical protein